MGANKFFSIFTVTVLTITSVYGVIVNPTPGPEVTPSADAGPVTIPVPPPLWKNAYFRGTPNNFGFTPMVYLGGLWRTNQTFGTNRPRFKITRYGDWSEAYPSRDYFITQGPGTYTITFDDRSKEISAIKTDGRVDVQFQCDKGDTFPGQSVYAIGNIPELGNWDLAKAVRLSPKTYPSWRGTFPIKIGQRVSWKCVKRLESNPYANVEYEPGPNNEFVSKYPTTVFGSF